MKRLVDFVAGRPWVALGVVALLCLGAVLQIVDVPGRTLRLEFDPSVNRLFPKNDPAREYYDYVRRLFGSDDTIVVALVDRDGIFTRENLEAVARISERLEDLEGIHHVTSLANALNIKGVDGDLLIEPFISEIPSDPEGLAAIRDEALGNPIYAGNLVARSGEATAIFVYVEEMTDSEFLAAGLDRAITQAADEERGDTEVWITGGPMVKAETTRVAIRDVVLTTPLIGLAMGLVAAFSFRTVRGVLLPLISIGLATLWSVGLIALSGRPVNLITSVVPGLVMTVGFAYAVHVVSGYYDVLRKGEREQAARHALEEVALPIVLTGVTTVIGFIALTLSPLEAVREFGVFCVGGVAAAVLAALLFVPAVLSLLPPKAPPGDPDAPDRFGQAMGRLADWDLRNRTAVLGLTAVVGVLSLWGMTRIQVSMDQITVFKPEKTIRKHFEAINEQLEGSNLFYVVVETDYRDAFKEPVNLREIEALQGWLDAQPEVGGSTSVVDYVKLINRGFHDGDPEYLAIPDSKRLITQLLFFGANDELEGVVDSRYQTASVIVRAKVADTGEVEELIQRIEARVAELPEHLEGRVTGNSVLVTRTIDALSRGQALSLSVAFVLIYGILALLFTSFRVGLLALIPNALPVVVYFGALGWTGITLNPTTSLVACLVLGIAVDDTIHYLAHFNTAAKKWADERRGAIEALMTVGRPVTFTTAALCLGFLALTLSEMRTQVEFGALAAFTLLVAWVVDVTVTPALSSHLRIVTLWDVLSLDLGRDPAHSIPLFRGLRTSQARIVALMMDIRSVDKDHKLFETGQSGNDMYVVLEGELSVQLRRDGRLNEVARIGRGDVVGEVALFSGRRSADVETLTPARLLRFEQEDLRRLRRRYPRIGATVLANLSEVLADRLVEANRRLA